MTTQEIIEKLKSYKEGQYKDELSHLSINADSQYENQISLTFSLLSSNDVLNDLDNKKIWDSIPVNEIYETLVILYKGDKHGYYQVGEYQYGAKLNVYMKQKLSNELNDIYYQSKVDIIEHTGDFVLDFIRAFYIKKYN